MDQACLCWQEMTLISLQRARRGSRLRHGNGVRSRLVSTVLASLAFGPCTLLSHCSTWLLIREPRSREVCNGHACGGPAFGDAKSHQALGDVAVANEFCQLVIAQGHEKGPLALRLRKWRHRFWKKSEGHISYFFPKKCYTVWEHDPFAFRYRYLSWSYSNDH